MNKFVSALGGFATGAILLSLFSLVQKLAMGIAAGDPRAYVVPFVFGGLSGTIIGLLMHAQRRMFMDRLENETRTATTIAEQNRALEEEIAERERTEEALRLSQRHMAIILDSIDASICVSDFADNTILFANRTLHEIHGHDLEGRPCWSLYHPDQNGPCPLCPAEELILDDDDDQPGRIIVSERRNSVSGRHELVHLSAARWTDGRLVRLSVGTDVTDLKTAQRELGQAEERYRSIFENALEGIFQLAEDGTLLNANPALLDILGYASRDALRAVPGGVLARLCPDPIERDRFVSLIAETGRAPDYETRTADAAGRDIWLSITARAVRLSGGDRGLEGMVQDITARKRKGAELAALAASLEAQVVQRTADLAAKAQELEAANLRLVELDAAKSDFLSTVSHEMRTPLTSILGFAKLISRDMERLAELIAPGEAKAGRLAGRVRRNLEIVEYEGERLARLINDFLDLSKIESGHMVWRDQALDPGELARRSAKAVKGHFARNPNLILELDIAPDLPWIVADQDRLEQVVVNLLSNAAKFTPMGRVKVRVAEDDGIMVIEVEDTGVGIPEEEQERIFDKFHQVAPSDSLPRPAGGTGLGLTICRQIVEHYGGGIAVTSELGRGSRFRIELPGSLLLPALRGGASHSETAGRTERD